MTISMNAVRVQGRPDPATFLGEVISNLSLRARTRRPSPAAQRERGHTPSFAAPCTLAPPPAFEGPQRAVSSDQHSDDHQSTQLHSHLNFSRRLCD